MLVKDPAKRIELIDIFEHPWMTKHKGPFCYEETNSENSLNSDEEIDSTEQQTPLEKTGRKTSDHQL